MKLEFNFGQPSSWVQADEQKLAVGLMNPLLRGSGREVWTLPSTGELRQVGDITLWQSPQGVSGVGFADVDDGSLQKHSADLYRQILKICAGYTIHRFWNFVPDINAPVGELDRYMCFCAGRGDALEHHALPLMGADLPPASAVGTLGQRLGVIFVAGVDGLSTVENPMQVPAYRYPPRYGPQPPSFARGGVVPGLQALFISGTASIRASESQHEGDVVAQAQLAIENLNHVALSANMPQACTAQRGYDRTVRVYLRDAQSLPLLAPVLDAELGPGMADINVIQADICRPELLVEIEAFAVKNVPVNTGDGGPHDH